MPDRTPYRDALPLQQAALRAVVAAVPPQLERLGTLLHARRPAFLGIGASYCAAALPTYLLQQQGVAASRFTPGQLATDCPPLGDAVVAVSQGGRSAETLAVLQRWSGTPSVAVVNVPDTPVLAAAHSQICLGGQPDSFASTIGFTGTLVALAMLAEVWCGRGIAADWADVDAIFEVAEKNRPAAADVAAALAGVASVDVAGSGPSVGIAEEAALLLREAANLPAMGTDTRTYLHGPMESAGRSAHLFLGGEREAQAALMLVERGHTAVLCTATPGDAARELRDKGGHVVVIDLPGAAQRALAQIVWLQHVVLDAARLRGCDIDEFTYSQGDTKIGEVAA